jgi:hypothetical protein
LFRERAFLSLIVYSQDSFGAAAIAAGISVDTLRTWSVDPQVKGKSVFDQLEDTNAGECLEKMVALNA